MNTTQQHANRFVIIVSRLFTAIRFLTIVPLRWYSEFDDENFKKCLYFFPIVGAGIGGIGALASYVILHIFPTTVTAAIAVTYLAFISNCLHLDGLSDSGDGLLSSRTREESLAIMKDSRVGAMGVIVLCFLLICKFAALSTLEKSSLCVAIFFMPLAGRTVILFTMATVRYARPEGGLGSLFYNVNCRKAAVISLVILGLLLCLYDYKRGMFCLFTVLAGAIAFNRVCKSKLGGATGDTLGANCEIAEMMIALSFSATIS